jgi:sec-independent protein translocase protein TatC
VIENNTPDIDSDNSELKKEISINTNKKEMPFTQHLEELRQSIIISAIALVLTTIICFYFNKELIELLLAPLKNNIKNVEIIFVSPGEAFTSTIRASLLTGLILALPIILNRLYWFIGPGLTKKEKVLSIPVLVFSYILFLMGITFSYKLLLPFGIKFLVEFAPTNIHPMISIGNYISFSSTLIIGTGIVFQLPIIITILGIIGIVNSILLKKYRKHFLLVSFVLGAIITPSVDMITQSILAAALYLLYEISIISVTLVSKIMRQK